MPIADFSLGDALLTTLSVFFFVIWIWILITIIGDVFRDHELSGWAKAGWVFLLIFIPVLTALIYLGTRGQGMRDRAIAEQAEMRRQMDSYVRETAASSPVDELAKLSALKDKGAISAEEFDRAKAKLLA